MGGMIPIRVDLEEWELCSPNAANSPLAGIFLHDRTERELADHLTETGMLEILELRQGLSLQTSSYVGRINLGNIELTIRPKLRGLPFLQLLRYAYGLRDLKSMTRTSYNNEELTFQDMLIQQLIAEIEELVARGLHRKYVQTESELASPRGKINVLRIAKQGGILQATLPCTYYPRLEDCLPNQVLLQGLHLAARLTGDTALRMKLYQLVNMFQDTVSSLDLDDHVLAKLQQQMDRLIAAYQPAITLIDILYHAGGIALQENQPQLKLPGFLFDMNLFFQKLLSRFLQENLTGYEVRDQYRIQHMLSYDPSHNPRNRRAPEPRPDYVILQQGKLVSILDAKYRDLWNKELPASMLYQLAMYALSQPDSFDAVILYPSLQPDVQEARITIHHPLRTTNRGSVVLRPVNLLHLAKLLSEAKTAKQERARTSFARQLAFGEETQD